MKVSIGIIDWDKFKSRKDVSSMTFFKCDSDIGFREDLLGLSITTKWIWIFILGLMAKRMKGEFEVTLNFIQFHNPELSTEVIHNCLQELHQRELLVYSAYEDSMSSTNSELNKVTSSNLELLQSDVSKKREEKKRKEKKREECEPSVDLIFFDIDSLSSYRGNVNSEIEKRWLDTYQDQEWVKLELNKAVNWIIANSHKAPKRDFKRFYNNWLSRAWEAHRKSLKSSYGPQGINKNLVLHAANLGVSRIDDLPDDIKSQLSQSDISYIKARGLTQIGKTGVA